MPDGARLFATEFVPGDAAIAQRLPVHAGIDERVTVIVGTVGDGGATIAALEQEHGFRSGSLAFLFVDHDKDAYLPDHERMRRRPSMATCRHSGDLDNRRRSDPVPGTSRDLREEIVDPRYNAYFEERLKDVWARGQARRPRWFLGDPEAYDPYLARPAHFVARGALEYGRDQLPPHISMRPDGELLLYLLAHELVARPVLALNPTAGAELSEELTDDTAAVIRRAAALAEDQPRGEEEHVRAPERPEISAHKVIDAASQTWPELRSARWGIWNRYKE
jgi:hypothetical protein